MDSILLETIQHLTEQAITDRRRMVVGAGIVHSGKLLLVRRAATENFLPEYWEIPGGKVDPGESVPEALIREMAEETALVPHAVKAFVGHFDYDFPNGLFRQFTFLIDVVHPELSLNPDEHDAFLWLDPREADQLNALRLTPQMRETLDLILARMTNAQAATSISA